MGKSSQPSGIGGLTLIASGAVEVLILAEAFRPQLSVPVCDELETVCIRHHDGNVLASLHRHILHKRGEERGVFLDVGVAALLVHITRALQETLDIDIDDRRGEQTDGTKLAESAADAVGNIEGLIALFLRYFDKVAAVGGSGGDDVIFRLIAQLLFENIVDDEVLGHRLGSATRLGDDVEHGLFDVDDVKERLHSFGVDVVLDVELGTLALALGQVVVMQMAYSLERRNGTERAAAYAEYDEVLEILADLLCCDEDVFDDFVLIVRKFRPTHHALASACGDRRESRLYFFDVRSDLSL